MLVTSGPSIQWHESDSEFLMAPQTLSNLYASAYITHSAQTAFHILFRTGKLLPFNK